MKSDRSIWWLVLACAAMSLLLWRTGRWEPRLSPDSHSYLEFDWSSATGVLSGFRTPGYPLFVRLLKVCGIGIEGIPIAHSLCWFAAVFMLRWGLRQAGYAASVATFASLALVGGRAVMDVGQDVLADSLAVSSAVAACGAFFAFLGDTRPRRACLLALLTFATYQIRPAYLFLIPLWPVLTAMFELAHLWPASTGHVRVRRCLTICIVTVAPFVLYCTLRLILVGHWGLVSFGGYNIVGATGQFIDQDLIVELSPEVWPIAEEILKRRQKLPDWRPPEDFLTMEEMFNTTVWKLAVPATKSVVGEDSQRVNQSLGRLSHEIITLRPRRYAQWLAWNTRHAWGQIVRLTATDLGTLLVCGLLVWWQMLSLWHGTATSKPVANLSPTAQPPDTVELLLRERHVLFWTTVGFVAAKAALVILVEPANDRYMLGAMPLVPAALAVAVHSYSRR